MRLKPVVKDGKIEGSGLPGHIHHSHFVHRRPAGHQFQHSGEERHRYVGKRVVNAAVRVLAPLDMDVVVVPEKPNGRFGAKLGLVLSGGRANFGAAFCHKQRRNRHVSHLVMSRQVKPLREQRLDAFATMS